MLASNYKRSGVLFTLLVMASFFGRTPALADDLGGDDVKIEQFEYLSDVSLDIAANGDMYAACEISTPDDQEIRIFRSTDHGDHWDWWATLSEPGWGNSYEDPYLQIVEGYESRCYLAFRRGVIGDDEIRLVSCALDLEVADFTNEITVLAQAGVDFANPRFTSSLADYSWFYLFLVAEGDGPAGTDIWFSRSTDLGDSFEPGYALTTMMAGTGSKRPDIAYGKGSNLHVTWFNESDDNNFEDSIRYRRGEHGANEGISEWNSALALTSSGSGYYESEPRIEASATTDEVVIVFQRRLFQPPVAYLALDPAVMVSTNRGLLFGSEIQFAGPFVTGGIEENPVSGQWTIGGSHWNTGINTSETGNLEVWSDFQEMGDQGAGLTADRVPSLALNPARGWRAAIIWNLLGDDDLDESDRLMFDGDWRGDPGYPNFAEGFPLPLTSPPSSAPALVDVNNNGNLEIVFSDHDHLVHVVDYAGNELPGWPVQVGEELSDCPVAVGDLRKDGQQTIVVGTMNGRVHAYDHQGLERSGWPQYMETDNPAYVSIGAVGAGAPRSVVVCCGPRIRLFDFSGDIPPNGIGWVMNPHTFTAPAAIGDIDGDGIAEIVGSIGDRLFAYQFAPPHFQKFYLQMTHEATAAVTLADLDQDGDVEILYPEYGGLLHAFDGDGTPFGGNWPYQFPGGGLNLTSATIGKMQSQTHPVIAVVEVFLNKVSLLNDDGSERSGFPKVIGPIFQLSHAAPVIGLIEGVLPEVVASSTLGSVYAIDHDGNDTLGWPKSLGESVYLSSAVGDLDENGQNEVVVLTENSLVVLDVLTPTGDPARMWSMSGHDPQRTACADCSEDLVSPARDDTEPFSKLMFAGSSPNPVQGPSVFHFSVPRQASVELSIYDLRGRKIATVRNGEFSTGEHFVSWNGRDDQGRPLHSGQYLAQLRVWEAGGQLVVTRKVTVLH